MVFGQIHRFIDSGRLRDLIHQKDLIQTQMQNVPHRRVQILQLAGQQLFQVKIQLAAVLQHTIA